METAQQALLKNAERAFKQVESSYAIPFGLSSYLPGPIWQNFHFVEANRWAYYLRYIAHFNVQKKDAEKVEGVTHSYDSVPKIGINRCYHTFATLVHESVHFFSHYAFRKSFNVNEYEGATEYLTRSLLNEYGPRKDSHGQGDIYNHEFALLLTIITDGNERRQLCKAYFSGDIDSISLIKERLRN